MHHPGYVRRRVGGRWWLLLMALGLLVVGLILWAAVVEPPWLLPDTRGLSPADRVRAQTDFRNTLVTMLGGLAVLVGGAVGAANLVLNQRIQWRAQVTERFSKAIEQLGEEKLDVRIGAAYALEQIARDSAELHWPIMEVLTAYLREHARASISLEERPSIETLPADHQAIATVIGRRRVEWDPEGLILDLHGANLPGVDWDGAYLQWARLEAVHLEEADLRGAHLEHTDLERAYLTNANLSRSDLVGANLSEANLSGADLVEANLSGADLSRADLSGAQLLMANLKRADLDQADLGAVDLGAADLSEAKNLQLEQLAAATGFAERLPPGLTEELLARRYPSRASEPAPETPENPNPD